MTTLLLAEVAKGHLADITARALTAAVAIGAPVHILITGQNVAGAAAAAGALPVGAPAGARRAGRGARRWVDLLRRIAP